LISYVVLVKKILHETVSPSGGDFKKMQLSRAVGRGGLAENQMSVNSSNRLGSRKTGGNKTTCTRFAKKNERKWKLRFSNEEKRERKGDNQKKAYMGSVPRANC